MVVEPVRVFAFLLTTGEPLFRVPFTGFSRTDTLNEAGSMSVSMVWTDEAARLPIREVLRPWRVGLAAVQGDRIVHAGPVMARKWDVTSQKLTFSCGGGWSLFDKRLVVKHDLDSGWADGEVVQDEDNPAVEWTATYTGSYTDIAKQLVDAALEWGALAVTTPSTLDGGLYTRTYYGWDLALVGDRLTDLTELENGPELEFTPVHESGHFGWTLRGAPELMDTVWQWNSAVPGQRVQLVNVDEDGDDMASQSWGLGGKTDDLILTARAESDALTGAGWPELQVSNTSHSSVSELATLQGYVAEDVLRGSVTQESFEFHVGIEYWVHPGDWANIRVNDVFIGERLLPVKITEVSSDLTEWQTVRASLRVEG